MSKKKILTLVVIFVLTLLLIVSLAACCKSNPESDDIDNTITQKDMHEMWLDVQTEMENVWANEEIKVVDLTNLNIGNAKYDIADFGNPIRAIAIDRNPIVIECKDSDLENFKNAKGDFGTNIKKFDVKFTKIENTSIYVSNICSAYNFFTNDIKKVGDAYYSKDETKLIRYIGNSETYEILENTTTIGFGAFANNKNLKSLNISEGVKNIETCAFSGCEKLESVTISSSVENIDSGAFLECSQLSEINIPENSNIEHIGWGALDENASWYQNKLEKETGILYFGKFAYSYLIKGEKNINLDFKEGTKTIAIQFKNYKNIESIKIPSSVTKIEDGAFTAYPTLNSISVDGKNTKYKSAGNCLIETETNTLILGCKNSVIPTDGSVTSIGDSAFYKCDSISNITIPDSVTSIGDKAFYKCSNLSDVITSDSIESVGAQAFKETSWYDNQSNGIIKIGKAIYAYKGEMPEKTSLEIEDGPISISPSAFSNCANLISITIPDSVTSIEDEAFKGCENLTNIILPNNINKIAKGTFEGCLQLNNITISDSVITIESRAFARCENLVNITIPKNIISICEEAFNGCSMLKNINIPAKVDLIGWGAFSDLENLEKITVDSENKYYHVDNNCLVETKMKVLVVIAKNYVIPTDNSVTSIGNYAFSGNKNLTNIIIPDGIVNIGDYAFSAYENLESVTISNSIKVFGKGIFEYCTKLTQINYDGTKADFEAIKKAEGVDNWYDDSSITKVKCTDGEIEINQDL